MRSDYQSWGRHPFVLHKNVYQPAWLPESLAGYEPSILPYGQGRSYGDCALNNNGSIISTKGLNRFISFDAEAGLLTCEAGVTLSDILKFAVPRGWFLPVTPGTKFVSVGGAIANDVHGKNHHRAGCFGNHVPSLTLLRSDGIKHCSKTENPELYAATIAGLGLTGLILSATIQLKKIQSAYVETENIKFVGLDEYQALSAESDSGYDYTVAWIDCVSSGEKFARGIYMRGNHADEPARGSKIHRDPFLNVPFVFPDFMAKSAMNHFTMKLFNSTYYAASQIKSGKVIKHYDPFFYPLDMIDNWNRGYGKMGMLQFQCAVPGADAKDVIKNMLTRIVENGSASFLSVLKDFGDIKSPGMLSFPRKGMTLCMDFPFRGESSLKLFKDLEQMTLEAGGALYPAKDACMLPETYKKCYPEWEKFKSFIDPAFSSSFWRRVMGEETVKSEEAA